MAGDMNVVAIVGRLTRDSEIRYSQNGGAVARFSVAVNRRKRVGDRWEDEANFFDCVYFGKSAEGVQQYLTKGRQVSITGELHQSRWESDGQTHTRVEIFVNNLSLIGGNNQSGGDGQSQYSRPSAPARPQQGNAYQNRAPRQDAPSQSQDPFEGMGPEAYNDDDVPF
jgi:single stranded DNA-binding protein (ssb)